MPLFAPAERKVILLGAGASRGATVTSRISGRNVHIPLDYDFFTIAQRIASSASCRRDFKERVRQLVSIFKIRFRFLDEENKFHHRLPRLEEAFSLLYVTRHFREVVKSSSGRTGETGNDVEKLAECISDVLIEFEVGQKNKSNLYSKIVKRCGANTSYLSMNYDTLLDHALLDEKWNPRGYCLGGDARKFIGLGKTFNHEFDSVILLKLHGSLNWFIKGNFKNMERVFTSRTAKVALDLRKKSFSKYMRQIVPPVFGKDFVNSQWRKLWDRGYTEMLNADSFVVVGSSLAKTDFHLKALLWRVTGERKRSNRPFKKMVVVDPCADTAAKWKGHFKGSSKSFVHYRSVKEFSAHL